MLATKHSWARNQNRHGGSFSAKWLIVCPYSDEKWQHSDWANPLHLTGGVTAGEGCIALAHASESGPYLQRSASKHPRTAQAICTAQPPRWVLRWRRSRAQRPQRAPQSAHERAPLGSAASRCSPETPLRYPVSRPLPIDAAHSPRCPQPPIHTPIVSDLHTQITPQLRYSKIGAP